MIGRIFVVMRPPVLRVLLHRPAVLFDELGHSVAIAVEMTDSGQYAAIDRAAEELARVVALELARQELSARSHRKPRADTGTFGLASTRHAPRTIGGS